MPDCFLHDIYAMYRAGYSYQLRHKCIQVKYLGYPAYLLRKAVIGFLETLDPRLFAHFSIMQGGPFLVKYLGIENRQFDMLIKRLEKTSEILGVRSFLNNPKDAAGDFVFVRSAVT